MILLGSEFVFYIVMDFFKMGKCIMLSLTQIVVTAQDLTTVNGVVLFCILCCIGQLC